MVQLQHDHSKERSGKFQINSSSTGDTKKTTKLCKNQCVFSTMGAISLQWIFFLYTVYSR